MKLELSEKSVVALLSHPSRGAWIEIYIEIQGNGLEKESHPSRGAWIEIKPTFIKERMDYVAPLAGCVD